MKKIFTFFLFVIAGFVSYSQLRVGLIGGPQSTSITEENSIPGWSRDISPYYTNRLGGNVGLLGEVPLGSSTRWFLHPGLLYQTKGRKFFKRNDTTTANLTDTLTTSRSFFNTYIEIPLNLAYKLPLGKKARFFISAGPYVSFFYNGKESIQARLYSNNSFKKEDDDLEVGNAPNKIKTIDFGVNGRAGFDLGNVLITGFFSQGLNNFYTASYDGTFKHKVIGASVGFWLNKVKWEEKKPKDTDKDGVADKQDICPTIPGPANTWGCPDKDGDAIADLEDKCPEIAGTAKYNGCPVPDSDKDGLNDEADKCPTVAGTVKYDGCPVPDTDGDQISDESDMCPDKPGPVEFNGCPIPDSDGDGLNDKQDKCPQEKGSLENNGCPEIKKEIIEKVNYAAKNIFFETKSDKLSPQSFGPLKEVVLILSNNPQLDLQIEGHTDNTGNPSFNLNLSERRANAVKKYFADLGIEELRLKALGFGQEKPVADNNTPDGKAKNRRVELKPVQR
ncbi:MAG: OmpA family protein [Chitinophagaceae bacterium]|nr:OmpA family protein [Chitinophagaceae bacterium]